MTDPTEAISRMRKLLSDADAQISRPYQWQMLHGKSVPPHNFYLSVPVEFDGVRYTAEQVDAAIDAALRVGAVGGEG